LTQPARDLGRKLAGSKGNLRGPRFRHALSLAGRPLLYPFPSAFLNLVLFPPKRA
jgi:hypothetical protein